MKEMYAVVDRYHEGKNLIIAVCKTYESAEKFIQERAAAEKKAGNNYDFDIVKAKIEIKTKREVHNG